MLFERYQYRNTDLIKRGYSQNCKAVDSTDKQYWVKWIFGIEKNDTKAKILADKLRHLQKARHSALPDIIEYGFDEEQKAFAIVYELLEQVDTLETKVHELKTQGAITGLYDLADCLKELHLKFKINHGDIHPANILIDKTGQFYLVDFGLADITKTLSQTKELEIFARGFAAPEKLSRLIIGFPYQADIFSIGKVIEWFFDERQEQLDEEQILHLQKMLAEDPIDRPNWQQVIDILKNFAVASETQTVQVAFRAGNATEILYLLNTLSPVFDISPKDGSNYLLDIVIGNWLCEGGIWVKSENKLLFNTIKPLDSLETKIVERKIKEGKKMPFKFEYSTEYRQNKADLTPYFQKWFELKQKQALLSENRKAVREELGFYRELLEKEKEVIAKNSLRVQYSNYEVKGDEIIFNLKQNDKYSSIGFILKHIEEGNDVNSEGFEYIVSANADRKQNKEVVEFAGKPFEFHTKDWLLKIKDCERLKKDSIPQSGFLFENTNKKEEEKNRQLDAIRKVDKNEVQNSDLIYFLFKPDGLPPVVDNRLEELAVFQKDKTGYALIYSDNQRRAIENALNCTPLSVIQGPPGTGKTTVITEIVFQILAKKPEAKILITSQTNNAVDQVLENLLKNEISILRLNGITMPRIQSIRKHTLDRKLEGWKQQVRETAERNFKIHEEKFIESLQEKNPFAVTISELILKQNDWGKAKQVIENIVSQVQSLHQLHNLPDDKVNAIKLIDQELQMKLSEFFKLRDLHRDWIVTINSLDEKSAINQKLIDSIRVIGATCNHIAAKKYAKYNFEFDYVIMDESGKATTAEALVPIITGKNLIYVGDHRQLRPMLTTTREVESWLREKFKKESDEFENWEDYFNRPSLFEQVILNVGYDYKAQLTECRRSSAEQVKLTSKCFYESEGDDAIEPVSRDISAEHNLPIAIDSSLFFIDIGSHYKNEKDNNSSSLNKESARVIPEILELLNKYERVKDYSFGVITGYSAQCRELKNSIDKIRFQGKINSVCKWNKPDEKLTISVVDRFQGLERDIVIVDLVKSGPGLDLGFLEVPNRINVALSRQKKLLIIVGDYHSIINAKTRRLNGEKAALQEYLELLKNNWIVKAENIAKLFPSNADILNIEDNDVYINNKQRIDDKIIKQAATETWDLETNKIELNTFFNSLVHKLKGFKLKEYGYKTFQDLCIDYGFNIEKSNNGKIFITPTFDFVKPTAQIAKNILPIPFDKALIAFNKSNKDTDGKVNTKDFYKQLCIEIKGFNPLKYGGRFNEFYKAMGCFEIIEQDKDTKFLRLIDEKL
jgi:superfamily I DNA and/or RNA helicase